MRSYAIISRAARRARAVAVVALTTACTTGGDSVTQPTNVAAIPWALSLNYGAANLAVGEELQLRADPLRADGTPFVGAVPRVVYTVSDTNVAVSDAGILVGKAPRSNVMVIAKLSSAEGNWTVADTLRVRVTEAPVDFTSLELRLDGPAVVPANRFRRFDAVLRDAGGNVVLDVEGDTLFPITRYEASVPKFVYDITNPWGASGFSRNVGDVTVRGTSYMYGREVQAEASFRITYPDSAILLIYRVDNVLNPSPSMMSQTDLTVIRNGKVGFRNMNTTEEVDIVFDDLASVVGGSIAKVSRTTTPSVVQFPNLGTFTYRSSKGFGGTITVVDP